MEAIRTHQIASQMLGNEQLATQRRQIILSCLVLAADPTAANRQHGAKKLANEHIKQRHVVRCEPCIAEPKMRELLQAA